MKIKFETLGPRGRCWERAGLVVPVGNVSVVHGDETRVSCGR